MCGIAGILRFDDDAVSREALERMLSFVAHRGPDGRGVETYERCGLAHSRLSVVDLMGGHQPMHVTVQQADDDLILIFNGEIYNHRTLRRLLESRGHQFRSDHSDTEVLVHGYREWGTELPKHLHGMFAFAVWDIGKQQLFLCRDRIGKKPLYVWRDGKHLRFASLISAIAGSLDELPAIDQVALSQYLTFGYTFHDSLLEGIREVPAAHWMLIDANGREQAERYWQPPPLSKTSTKLGATRAIEELLIESVSGRLEADVPLGCFLSGGIDSSLIAAMAQKLCKGEKLKTFSVAMPDAAYDESPWATKVAAHLETEHHVLRAEPNIEADLRALIAVTGEPIGDASILPTYWLSRATREHVTVALSGDGGDELFGGYARYRALGLLAQWRGLARLLPADLIDTGREKSRRHQLARLARAARYPNPGAQYLDIIRLLSPRQLGWLGVRTVAPMDAPPGWRDDLPPIEAARQWDLMHYLPFDLLRKVDRSAMAVALEVRCPMLDTQVMDLAGHLPLSVLMPGGRPKALLREVASKYLPPDITSRPKMGFAIPIGRWFREDQQPLLRQYLLEQKFLEPLGLRIDRVEKMIQQHAAGRADHSHRLFALLSLAIWLQWLTDPKPWQPSGG
jgi:asparagine synthase (glutamine-hydrolysing)